MIFQGPDRISCSESKWVGAQQMKTWAIDSETAKWSSTITLTNSK